MAKHAVVLVRIFSVVLVGDSHAWNVEWVDIHLVEGHADKDVLLLLLGLGVGVEEVIEDIFEGFYFVNGALLLLLGLSHFVFFDS